jgi:murein DD-endopeptidase MepM/ murein hydrolase activator NlpD
MGFVAAALVAVFATSAGASDCAGDAKLPSSVPQGALVIGDARPGSVYTVQGHESIVGDDGVLVFGVARDAPVRLEIKLRCPAGTESALALRVEQREYAIERVEGLPEKTVNPPPEIAERIAREQAQVTEVRKRDDARRDFLEHFAWPVRARISGVYGSQRVLNGTPKDPHLGLDLAAPEGTPVHAPAGGIVTLAQPDYYLTGGTVILDHGHGVSSAFIHLSKVSVKAGQVLEQGDVLGEVGKTGRATGPHLHWGLNWFDTRLDPELLIDPPR